MHMAPHRTVVTPKNNFFQGKFVSFDKLGHAAIKVACWHFFSKGASRNFQAQRQAAKLARA